MPCINRISDLHYWISVHQCITASVKPTYIISPESSCIKDCKIHYVGCLPLWLISTKMHVFKVQKWTEIFLKTKIILTLSGIPLNNNKTDLQHQNSEVTLVHTFEMEMLRNLQRFQRKTHLKSEGIRSYGMKLVWKGFIPMFYSTEKASKKVRSS